MAWELCELNGSLGSYADDWDRLNRELCHGNPYCDSRFVDPLLKHFAKGHECLCIFHNGSNVSSMIIVERCGFGKWRTFLPAQAQLAPVLAREPNELIKLIFKLPGYAVGLDCLSQDPAFSQLTAQATELRSIAKNHAFTISVALNTSFEHYWSTRPKKMQQNVDRRLRRARERYQEIELRRTTNPRDLESAVDRFGLLESRGWKGKAGTAIHPGNRQGQFYSEVMRRFSESAEAIAYELFFDGRLVASRIAIASSSMLVMLKTTYDEDEAKLAPGRLLLHLLLEKEFTLSYGRSIEFYTNANEELAAWGTDSRWISHHFLLRNRIVRLLYVLIQKHRRGASKTGRRRTRNVCS